VKYQENRKKDIVLYTHSAQYSSPSVPRILYSYHGHFEGINAPTCGVFLMEFDMSQYRLLACVLVRRRGRPWERYWQRFNMKMGDIIHIPQTLEWLNISAWKANQK
jgi:hypothetical protein